ncbi:Hypothetical_protein [Hexamita inflata]|uniref:Hypothetical_protein n=1 Tax=Hexamita inflata TaxID=28002 RepID=A0AA86UJ51_9EUKA|nr:Hypothetical protein HINF_LOCUS40817 [Hexamita inflata]
MRYQFNTQNTVSLIFLFVFLHLVFSYAINFAVQYKSATKTNISIFDCIQRALLTSITYSFYRQCTEKPTPYRMRDLREFYHARTTQMMRQIHMRQSQISTADY